MKVTSSQSKPVAITPIVYPCLMEATKDGTIVLFREHGHGTIVYGGTGVYKGLEGAYHSYWGMNFFVPYHGTVTITS